MKVFPQIVYDQVTGKEICFGLELNQDYNGKFRQKALDYIEAHQEWRGGERLEYINCEREIHFIWDMTDAEFKVIQNIIPDDNGNDINDYLGACFFGKFKLEFIRNDIAGCFVNLYEYGVEDKKDQAYAYLEDGMPYEERFFMCDDMKVPHRRTFESFAEKIEAEIIEMLNKYPEYIKFAFRDTVPANWYPGERYKYTRDFTREN